MTKLIAVSSIEFDLDGARVLRQDAGQALSNHTGARRVSRTATLDGGCVLYDTGYAVADRTIVVSAGLEHLDWLARMCQLYSLVRVSTDEGIYIGAPRRWYVQDNRANMDILITEES